MVKSFWDRRSRSAALFFGCLWGGMALAIGADAAPAVPSDAVSQTSVSSAAPEDAFAAWLARFRQKALAEGIRADILDRALAGIRPDPEIIDADRNQPEFVRPIWDYLTSAISEKRVMRGQEELVARKDLLGQLEARYGVPREVVVAIWGLESHFGKIKGNKNVIRSLATLAYDGRRADFGTNQLLAALHILQRGDIAPEAMLGSWAGAMGHTQFIPTTYNEHAIDFDGDGKRDIWTSVADALASTANYLSASGWQKQRAWGYEVVLPQGFDVGLTNEAVRKPLSEWAALGIVRMDGDPMVEGDAMAGLLMPAGYQGPAFLVRDNFRVVLRYNNATAYSLAVNLLADRFRGRPGVRAAWPVAYQPLSLAQREELQQALLDKGFDPGGVDGVIGARSRKAIRAFQASVGLPADGHATLNLLERLRGDS